MVAVENKGDTMKDLYAKMAKTQLAIKRWNRKMKLATGKLHKLHTQRLRIENAILKEKEKLVAEGTRTISIS